MSLKIEVKNQKEYGILMEFLEECTDIEWKDSGKPTNAHYSNASVELHNCTGRKPFMSYLGNKGDVTVKEVLMNPTEMLDNYVSEIDATKAYKYLANLLSGKTKKQLMRKTKDELKEYAKGMYGCNLSKGDLKTVMINHLIEFKARNEEQLCDEDSCCSSDGKDEYITSLEELEEGGVYEFVSSDDSTFFSKGDIITYSGRFASKLKFIMYKDNFGGSFFEWKRFKLKLHKEEKEEEKDLKGVVIEVDTESEYYEIQKELIRCGCAWFSESTEISDYWRPSNQKDAFEVNEKGYFQWVNSGWDSVNGVIFDAESFLENPEKILNKHINLSNKNSMSCCSSSDDRNFLEKMNDFLKKKIDSSTKKQCKAGLRDECCELTQKGKEKLITGLAETEKGTEILDDAAEDIIEERKDE